MGLRTYGVMDVDWEERVRLDRLRKEDPVHYCRDSEFGPYWSVTKYHDIMAVETNHQVYSSDSEQGGITIRDARPDLRRRGQKQRRELRRPKQLPVGNHR